LLDRVDADYESHSVLDVDHGSDVADRYVRVINDSGDDNDRLLALTAFVPISQGTHTFTLKGRCWTAGTLRLFEVSLLSGNWA
jgi:hypothetical protein